MPSANNIATLEKKLDQLSRQSPPSGKLLMDALYLICAELNDRERDTIRVAARVTQMEQMTFGSKRQEELQWQHHMDVLKRDVQQLEGTVREAELSFSVQVEMKQAQVDESIQRLENAAETLLTRVVPEEIDRRVRGMASTLREIQSAAMEAWKRQLDSQSAEATALLKGAAELLSGNTLDQLREECQVVSFSAMKQWDAQVQQSKASLQAAHRQLETALHQTTDHLAAFIAGGAHDVVNMTPLIEAHSMRGELLYYASQIDFVSGAVQSLQEAFSTAGPRLRPTSSEMPEGWKKETRLMRGFVSLWGVDEEVLEELALLSEGSSARNASAAPSPHADRAAAMKQQYLLSLPVFQALQGSVRNGIIPPSTPPPPQQQQQQVHPTRSAGMLGRKQKSAHITTTTNSDHGNESPLFLTPTHNTPRPPSGNPDPDTSLMSTIPEHPLLDDEDSAFMESQTHRPTRSSGGGSGLGLLVVNEDPLCGGVLVADVVEGSVADRSGFCKGDQILSLQRTLISDRDHLIELLQDLKQQQAHHPQEQGDVRFHIHRPDIQKTMIVSIPRSLLGSA